MIIFAVFFLFICLFLLPFVPGIIELVKKEDAAPLYISMNYTRNPRYFGESFRNILHHGMDGLTGENGVYDVILSKKEKLEICRSLEIDDGKEINHLFFVKGDLVSGSHVQFNKELYVSQNAFVGPNNVIQALTAEGNVEISDGTVFRRWLDAEGDIDIDENCNLGISVSSGGKVSLAGNCIFRRIYGMPITTGDFRIDKISYHEIPSYPAESFQPELPFIRRKDSVILPGTVINDHIVFTRDIQIGANCVIRGNIKSYGSVVLEANATIDGNVLADGDIFIEGNARISGHVFSQQSIYISAQTIIGCPHKIKSIIGKKAIHIEKYVSIYGYVSTEGNGIVL